MVDLGCLCMCVCMYTCIYLCLFLLFSQAEDVNRTLQGGRKPLHYAADCGQAEILEYLLSQGADVNVSPAACVQPSRPSAAG